MDFKKWLLFEMTTMGININDSDQAFTDQILKGQKTIETRNKPTLDPYIGRKVGIIRTGVGTATLVGYVVIGNPIFYRNKKEFDRDYHKHLISKDSSFYITEKGKWGYPLKNVEKTKEKYITSKGIVSRKL